MKDKKIPKAKKRPYTKEEAGANRKARAADKVRKRLIKVIAETRRPRSMRDPARWRSPSHYNLSALLKTAEARRIPCNYARG